MGNNNIFEGAKFGDKFVTRGCQQCIIIEPPYKINDVYRIDYVVKGESGIVSCDINGNVTDVNSDWDIVSRYKEQIDEDKLDELAVKYENKMYGYTVDLTDEIETDFSAQQNIMDIHDAFKAGYRKAMEE